MCRPRWSEQTMPLAPLPCSTRKSRSCAPPRTLSAALSSATPVQRNKKPARGKGKGSNGLGGSPRRASKANNSPATAHRAGAGRGGAGRGGAGRLGVAGGGAREERVVDGSKGLAVRALALSPKAIGALALSLSCLRPRLGVGPPRRHNRPPRGAIRVEQRRHGLREEAVLRPVVLGAERAHIEVARDEQRGARRGPARGSVLEVRFDGRRAQLRGLPLLHVARAPLGVEVRRRDVQAPPVAERHVRVHQPLHAHPLACRPSTSRSQRHSRTHLQGGAANR